MALHYIIWSVIIIFEKIILKNSIWPISLQKAVINFQNMYSDFQETTSSGIPLEKHL